MRTLYGIYAKAPGSPFMGIVGTKKYCEQVVKNRKLRELYFGIHVDSATTIKEITYACENTTKAKKDAQYKRELLKAVAEEMGINL